MRIALLTFVTGLSLGTTALAGTTAPSTRPDDDTVWQALSDGNQSAAESLVEERLRDDPKDAHALFLAAMLTRSRFDTAGAVAQFKRQLALSPAGDDADAARAVVALDTGGPFNQHPETQIAELHALMDRRHDDGAYAWLLAIECRTFKKNAEGIKAFTELAKHFEVGPVLFHQTFANILDEQEMYKESLPHRAMAVQLEPEPWSWSGLGDTYWRMNDPTHAIAAYRQALKLDPTDTEILRRLAENAIAAKDAPAAESAGKRLVELKPDSPLAHAYLGKAYRLEGDQNKVADEMIAICKLRPTDRAQARRAATLLRTLNRNDEADALDRPSAK